VLFVIAGIGAAIATRHVWLQHLPKDQVPECGPGLEYMLKKFALGQALEKILSGSGECAEAGWRFLGLSIAGWSLLWFVVLGIFAVLLVRFGRHRVAG
jgi:disulfide bond formation protein DsbB